MNPASDRADPGLYARSFADVYDEWYEQLHDVASIIAAVTARTGPRAAVLELGSGTGRITTPLGAHHEVLAIDASAAMLAQDTSSAARIAADMVAMPIRDTTFDAAIIAYNTIFNLGNVEAQRRCFAEAARVLRPGGYLVVEAFVAPEGEADTPFGMTLVPHHTDADARMAIVTWAERDEPTSIVGAHIELAPAGVRSRPWRLTYRTPAQLDELASRSGLTLVERHRDWSDAPFRSDDVRHVSWYRRD